LGRGGAGETSSHGALIFSTCQSQLSVTSPPLNSRNNPENISTKPGVLGARAYSGPRKQPRKPPQKAALKQPQKQPQKRPRRPKKGPGWDLPQQPPQHCQNWVGRPPLRPRAPCWPSQRPPRPPPRPTPRPTPRMLRRPPAVPPPAVLLPMVLLPAVLLPMVLLPAVLLPMVLLPAVLLPMLLLSEVPPPAVLLPAVPLPAVQQGRGTWGMSPAPEQSARMRQGDG